MKNSHLTVFISRRLLGLVLLADLLLITAVLGFNGYLSGRVQDGLVNIYLHSIANGHAGTGMPTGRGNSINLALLQPGDIILGSNPGCAYGYYTHAAIYTGGGRALEGWLTGIRSIDVRRFWTYDRACILRVKTTPAVRQKAAQMAMRMDGGLFFPLAFKPGERVWNCTKTIWKAYAVQGIDLDSRGDLWVAPDSIYRSPRVMVVAESGGSGW